jgi:N-formylmaleamate deformylase
MSGSSLSALAAVALLAPLVCAAPPEPVSGQIPQTYGEASVPAPFQVEHVGNGTPMILIPGMTSSGAVWTGMVEQYRDRYELHVVTLAGFAGVPPLEEGPFLPVVRDALLAYIQEMGLERPILVGHSLGAFLAFWVAASDPDAVGPVIAVDGLPFLPALSDPGATPEAMVEPAHQMQAFYATLTPDQMEAQARMAATTMVRDRKHVEEIASWGRDSSPSAAGTALAELVTTDLRGEVSAIRSPVLLLVAGGSVPEAQRDPMVQRYRDQVSGIPGVEVTLASHARHFIMLDDPDFLFREMDRFLGDHLLRDHSLGDHSLEDPLLGDRLLEGS